jgi:alpha-2-macroglobulin
MLAGEPRQAREILAQTAMPTAGRPRDASYVPGSCVRDAALLLLAWLDLEPTSARAAELARFLNREQRDGHWYTTQDDAMALLALGRYAQAVPEDTRPFRGDLILPDGNSRALTEAKDVHAVLSPDQPGMARITNAGPGLLYYVARAEGVPPAADIAEEDKGLSVRREFLDASGAPLNIAELHQGDLVVVKITLSTQDRTLDNIAIEELLPAGLEIENPNLVTTQPLPWIREKSDYAVHRDIRDDRLLLFTGQLSGTSVFYYAARAVTPGRFVVPAVTASCMYDPEIRSTSGRTNAIVEP